MLKAAIEKILDLGKPVMLEANDGREYSTSQLIGLKPPTPEPLALHTLTGIIDWLKSEDKQPCMLHVVSHAEVAAISPLERIWDNRDRYLVAKCDRQPIPQSYMEIEAAIIMLQSRFTETADRARVLAYLGNIRSEKVATTADDGITQTATVRNAIGRLKEEPMSPIVRLAPYRTFPEIEQPATDFLLRLRQGPENGLPQVALFEADGQEWQIEAIKKIGAWLLKNCADGQTVIA